MLVEQSPSIADSSSTTLPRLNSFISDTDDLSSFCPETKINSIFTLQDINSKQTTNMPKNKDDKKENTREKSADKKKGKRETSTDREPSPSPSRDSAAQQQRGKGNSKKEDDDGKCYTVKASPSHMAQCSNEQFLSSCLPLLATLSPKKNFLARINIQKAILEQVSIKPQKPRKSQCSKRNLSSVVSVGREMHAIKKGLLWQQRERIFSRWKERYFILTKDYLHCFKRSSGVHNISPMGQFIFKVKLVELEKVEWLTKKSYNAIGLTLQGRESRILLRAASGLEDWFEVLEECTITSKERRRALRKLHDPHWETPNGSLRSHDWLDNCDNFTETSSVMEAALKRRSRCGPDFDVWARPKHENRLSLLTDIDINSWGSSPPPSAPSTFRGRPYRFNTDVFFLPQGTNNNTATMSSGRSFVTAGPQSLRSGHFQPPPSNTSTHIRYRERSQSDALSKIRAPDMENKRASYVATPISNI